ADDVGVAWVGLYVDGSLVGSSSAAPFAVSWNTKTAADGVHTLQTRADDRSGNWDKSPPVQVTVSNGPRATPDTRPPVTAVTAPAAGATVSGTVAVSASATDDVGVTKVELYADGALLAAVTAAPYTTSWNTSALANGAHSLASKAWDAAGNAGTSAAVS